jgi:rubrerythrin
LGGIVLSIYEFALKMEHDGGIYYREVAQQCEDEWLKGIFEFLAMEEDKHYNIFKNMKYKNMKLELNNESNLDEYVNIFRKKSKAEVSKSLSEVQADIYVTCAEDEKKSIRLYEKMLNEIENQEEKQMLLDIIGEERKHLKFMEEIIELMNKLEEIKE